MEASVEMKTHRLPITKTKNASALAIFQPEELAAICEEPIALATSKAKMDAEVQAYLVVQELNAECERRIEEAAETVMCQGGSENKKERQAETEKSIKRALQSLSRSVLEADIITLKSFLGKYNDTLLAEWTEALKNQPKRGILMIAGPQKYSMNAFVSLWAVRKHFGSKLPIIIM